MYLDRDDRERIVCEFRGRSLIDIQEAVHNIESLSYTIALLCQAFRTERRVMRLPVASLDAELLGVLETVKLELFQAEMRPRLVKGRENNGEIRPGFRGD